MKWCRCRRPINRTSDLTFPVENLIGPGKQFTGLSLKKARKFQHAPDHESLFVQQNPVLISAIDKRAV